MAVRWQPPDDVGWLPAPLPWLRRSDGSEAKRERERWTSRSGGPGIAEQEGWIGFLQRAPILLLEYIHILSCSIRDHRRLENLLLFLFFRFESIKYSGQTGKPNCLLEYTITILCWIAAGDAQSASEQEWVEKSSELNEAVTFFSTKPRPKGVQLILEPIFF